MFEFGDPKTFWLNVTNIALGVVTGICVLFLGKALFQDFVQRIRATRRSAVKLDEYSFMVPELGLTMADGGERLDPGRGAFGDEKHWEPRLDWFGEEPNIHRSVN